MDGINNVEHLNDEQSPVILNPGQVTIRINAKHCTLENYLSQDINGKVILLSYENLGRMTKTMRKNLVHLVIARELEIAFSDSVDDKTVDFKITPEKFKILSQEILNLFPSEKNTNIYYSPHSSYQNEDGKKSPVYARGKLLDRYNYVKRNLKESKILVDGKNAATENITEDNVEEIEIEENGIEEVDKEEWLRNNTEPIDTLQQYWIETSKKRRDMLLNTEGEDALTSDSYFNLYPILKLDHKKAVELLFIDFDRVYPNVRSNAKGKWSTLRNTFVRLFTENRKKLGSHISDLVDISSLSSECQDGIVISLIPTLAKSVPVPAATSKKAKKRKADDQTNERGRKEPKEKGSRPSESEIRESFVLIVKNSSDVNSTVTNVRTEGVCFQPRLLFVGNTLRNLHSFYVLLNDQRFQFDTPFEAFEFCFTLHYSLDVKYSPQANSVWLMIQRGVYNIYHKSDKVPQHVHDILNEL